jgi:hypothetical protein
MPESNERGAGQATINGAALYYELAGAGDPVLLLHAFSSLENPEAFHRLVLGGLEEGHGGD